MIARAPRSASADFPARYFDIPNQDATVFAWRSNGDPSVRTISLNLATVGTYAVLEYQRNFQLLWHVRSGIGAVSNDYFLDALGTQQLCLPCDSLDVSLFARPMLSTTAYFPPRIAFKATASIADGSVSGVSATVTTAFSVDASTTVLIAIPPGARAWRLAGGDDPSSPLNYVFSPQMTFYFQNASGSDSWSGYQLAALHVSGGFIPLVGNSIMGLSMFNSGALTVAGQIIWELDL